MKKDKKKLIKEFRSIRKGVKKKLTVKEIDKVLKETKNLLEKRG